MKVSTQLRRYYRWKYSGPITVISLFAVGILVWHFGTFNIEFYEKFTCPQLMEYRGGDYGVSGQPRFNELDVSQKAKFEIFFSECIEQGWNPKIEK